jgi:hypothetical protein
MERSFTPHRAASAPQNLAEKYRSRNLIEKAIERFDLFVGLQPDTTKSLKITSQWFTWQFAAGCSIGSWEECVTQDRTIDSGSSYSRFLLSRREPRFLPSLPELRSSSRACLVGSNGSMAK